MLFIFPYATWVNMTLRSFEHVLNTKCWCGGFALGHKNAEAMLMNVYLMIAVISVSAQTRTKCRRDAAETDEPLSGNLEMLSVAT